MTFSRRPVVRLNRGRVATTTGVASAAPNPLAPLTFITSKNWIIYSVGDVGITESGGAGTGVTGWTNNAPPALHWGQAGAANLRPTLVAADARFGGRPSIVADGVNDFMTNATTRPAPGTTPTWARFIAAHVSRSAVNAQLFGAAANRMCIRDGAASPNVNAGEGVANTPDTAFPLGAAYAVDVLFTNSASDYLWIGANKPTGVALGNVAAAALAIFASITGTVPGNYALTGVWLLDGEPSGAERILSDAFCASMYPGIVLPV